LGNLTYAYDTDGRRTSSGGSLAAVTRPAACSSSTTAYNADNGQTKFGSASSISYDADGELKSDGTNTYTWYARRHLTGISGGATASFVYDAFGRRMKRTIGSSTVTQFLYDRLNPVQEMNSSNGVTANLLTGPNIDEFFTRTASSTTSTLLADALGSTIGLVGSAGSIATSYTYRPFGATTTGGAANTNRINSPVVKTITPGSTSTAPTTARLIRDLSARIRWISRVATPTFTDMRRTNRPV